MDLLLGISLLAALELEMLSFLVKEEQMLVSGSLVRLESFAMK